MIRLLTAPFRQFWTHRSLVAEMTRRIILLRTRGSYLGMLWQLMIPLMMMSLYTFVFGILLRGSFAESPPDSSSLLFGIGIYIGLTFLGLVTDAFNMGPTAITAHPNFVKKVVFPLEILPFAYFASSLIPFMVAVLLFTVAILGILGSIPPGLLLLPFVAIPVMLLALGIYWILAAVNVFIRDLGQVTQIFSQVAFWTSGIFFSASVLHDFPVLWNILKWNPILQSIDMSRKLLLWETPLNGQALLYLYIIGVVFFYVGYFVFRELKDGFADIM